MNWVEIRVGLWRPMMKAVAITRDYCEALGKTSIVRQ